PFLFDLGLPLITPCNPNVTAYLQRMDVIQHIPTVAEIDGQLPSELLADLSDVLLEVSRVTADHVDDVITRLGRMITTHYDLVLRSDDGVANAVVRLHERRISYVPSNAQVTGTWAWLRVRYP